MPIYVKRHVRAGKTVHGYIRNRGPVYNRATKLAMRAERKVSPKYKQALHTKNAVAWHLNFGRPRSANRRMQLRNTMDRLAQAVHEGYGGRR